MASQKAGPLLILDKIDRCNCVSGQHSYGLLRNSFRPPENIRALRTVWRLRDRHVKEAGRCVQHMQKALTEMNVQLANAISDLSGVSGQAILRAILGGERDPYKLAGLRDRRIAASEEEIARSLEGTWQEDLLFELRQAVEAYEFQQQQLTACDRSYRSIWRRCRRVPVSARTPRHRPIRALRVSPQERKNEKTGDPAEMHRSCSIWPRS